MLKATIVIPTYWRGPQGEGGACGFESDYIYDHATPLDEEGTLGRALDSLAVLRDPADFQVAVVAVPTRMELKQALELKVQSITARYEYRYPMMVIGPGQVGRWRQRLAQNGLYEYDHFLSLEGYSNVRNMCLLAAVLSSADVAILFDDDEVYEDPDYISKALEFIGTEFEGGFVGGVAGYYRQADDTLLLPQADLEWQKKWGSVESMNEAFGSIIERQPRLKKTPFVFGGNMVVHREVFEKIPFDPMIPRGEDIDYLMNAKMFGYDFFLDNELWIKHLPPPKCAPPWYQMRLDIIRFARERAKLEAGARPGRASAGSARPGDFDPYPGRFLKKDLHDIVFEACLSMAGDYLEEGREQDALESIMNIAISKAEAGAGNDPLQDYLEYRRQWQEFISIVPGMGIWNPGVTSD